MIGFSLICLMCLLPPISQAQGIHGVVKDAQSGERLPNAMLSIKGTTIGTKTNLEGYFVLTRIPDSAFTLQARYVGYEVLELKIDPKSDADNIVLELRPQDIILQGVTVVAQEATILKTEGETSLSTISPRQLATLPSAGQPDIFRSMQLLPGISGTNDRSSGLYVRGGTPDQNLVLFDGMTVYHVDHFFGFFSAFNPDAVKDVQFYKGGFPAQYGGRLSSVVDMIGKSGDPDNLHIGAGLNPQCKCNRRNTCILQRNISYRGAPVVLGGNFDWGVPVSLHFPHGVVDDRCRSEGFWRTARRAVRCIFDSTDSNTDVLRSRCKTHAHTESGRHRLREFL